MSDLNKEFEGAADDLSGMATVTLTLADDSVIECAILTVFPVDNQEYIALLPLAADGEANEDGEVYLYRYIDDGSENGPTLENIIDDDEYEAAADAFDEWMDTMAFDEMEE